MPSRLRIISYYWEGHYSSCSTHLRLSFNKAIYIIIYIYIEYCALTGDGWLMLADIIILLCVHCAVGSWCVLSSIGVGCIVLFEIFFSFCSIIIFCQFVFTFP